MYSHFSSPSFASPNEDPSLMGDSGRPPFTGGLNNPAHDTNNQGHTARNYQNDGGFNRMNNHHGRGREFRGLKDEWNNNYRSRDTENNDRGSFSNFNRRLENDPRNPSFNRPLFNPNGREDNDNPSGGSMPGITPHRMPFPNRHIRPPTPQNYVPISSPQDTNEPSNIEAAFQGCEKHGPSWKHSELINGHFETPMMPMQHNSHIAVYPLTDDNPKLMVMIMMPSRQYQVTVQGTNVMLEKCNLHGVQCTIEDEKATKTKGIINPQKWNYIYSHMDTDSVTVGIGAEVEVMSMQNVPPTDLDSAEWLVLSGDGSVRGVDEKPASGGPFVVEYPCAEYMATHFSSTPAPYPRTEYPLNPNNPTNSPHPHPSSTYVPSFTGAVAGYTTEKPDTDGNPTAALIVGVIGALVLLGLVIAIIVSVMKKRRSLAVTESTPLSEQKRSESVSQECEQKVDEQKQDM
ncbi:hypothetical protein FHG87_009629 [Trinorchestia longiramus]|nr:hypothetical protein FHG87_009629 [Trinorchestia longiramus]